MTTYADIRKMIEENDVEYIDVRFTDPRGKLQHLAMCEHAMDEDAFNEGILFDGSSIAGWKAINESDMLLVPCLLYTSPSPRDLSTSRMPSSA